MNIFTLPFGEYYIGDPLVLIPEAQYDYDLIDYVPETMVCAYRNLKFLIYTLPEGTKTLTDNLGNEYSIEGTAIAVIPSKLCELDHFSSIGHVHWFECDFGVEIDPDVIRIDQLVLEISD